MVRSVAFAIACAFAFVGCTPKGPEVRVLGVHEARRHEVVFVQVTNPAKRSMRLTKLEYTFAAQGTTVSTGKLALAREELPGVTEDALAGLGEAGAVAAAVEEREPGLLLERLHGVEDGGVALLQRRRGAREGPVSRQRVQRAGLIERHRHRATLFNRLTL